jgi:hypothetical protein
MQAILKGKHQRFCKWLQDIRDRYCADPQLDKLEEEMFHFYDVYQQKREELRKIISGYEEKQKNIRNKIKEYKRQDFKTGNNVHPVSEKIIAV